MGTENIKLSKGDELTLKGQAFKIAAQAKIRVIKVKKNPVEEEVTGEAKSDTNDDRFKKAACRIVEAKIRALEQKEMDNLCSIEEDDVLFLGFDEAEEAPKALISKHIGATNTILDLKQILKEIKAL